MFDQFISSLRFLKFKLFFFYLVEIISSTLIPLFRLGISPKLLSELTRLWLGVL